MEAENSTPEASCELSSQPTPTTTTKTYAGTKFHLHQVVRIPSCEGTYSPTEWIVVGLNNGLQLADIEFNTTRQYSVEEVQDAVIKPQKAATETPIFGY